MGWFFPVELKKAAGSKEDAQGLMNCTLADPDGHNLHYDDHNLYNRDFDDH